MQACVRCVYYLVLWTEFVKWYVRGEVTVVNRTKGQTVHPATAEISDLNILQERQEAGEQ